MIGQSNAEIYGLCPDSVSQTSNPHLNYSVEFQKSVEYPRLQKKIKNKITI